MFDFLTTVAAILITLAFCALLVIVETKHEAEEDRLENEKAKKLKFWLDKCAESRKKDKL